VPFLKNPRIKSIPALTRESIINNSVVSFYDNFGLIFKGLEDKVTNGIKNWSLSTTPLLIDASSREIHSEYLHKLYIARKYETIVSGEHLCG